MAEHIAAHLRAIQTVLEHGKALVFFRQQSNRYTVHGTRFISVSPPMLLRDKGSSQVTVVTKLIANSPLPENRKLQGHHASQNGKRADTSVDSPEEKELPL